MARIFVLVFGVLLLSVGRGTLASDPEMLEGRIQACGSYTPGMDAEKYLQCAKAFEHWYYNVRPKEIQRMQQEQRRQLEQEAQQRLERLKQEAERRRLMELEERRVRAAEEAARAQREQAERSREPVTCKTVGFQYGRPIVECR